MKVDSCQKVSRVIDESYEDVYVNLFQYEWRSSNEKI